MTSRMWVTAVLLIGLIVGTVGWIGDQFSIQPWWFGVAGFVMVILATVCLILMRRSRVRA